MRILKEACKLHQQRPRLTQTTPARPRERISKISPRGTANQTMASQRRRGKLARRHGKRRRRSDGKRRRRLERPEKPNEWLALRMLEFKIGLLCTLEHYGRTTGLSENTAFPTRPDYYHHCRHDMHSRIQPWHLRVYPVMNLSSDQYLSHFETTTSGSMYYVRDSDVSMNQDTLPQCNLQQVKQYTMYKA